MKAKVRNNTVVFTNDLHRIKVEEKMMKTTSCSQISFERKPHVAFAAAVALFICFVCITCFGITVKAETYAQLNPGSYTEYTLQGSEDIYFKITPSKIGYHKFNFRAYGSFNIYLYREIDAGTVFVTSTNGSKTSPDGYENGSYLLPGEYYLKVSNNSSKAARKFQIKDTFTEYTFNNQKAVSFEQPQTIKLQEKINGFVNWQNENDWFRLQVAEKGKYSFRMLAYDLRISYLGYSVYNSNLQQVYGSQSGGSFTCDLTPGTYYIKVATSAPDRQSERYTFWGFLDTPASQKKAASTPKSAAGAAPGSTYTAKNIVYYVTNSRTLTITNINTNKSTVTIPKTVTINNVSYPVTTIKANACRNNTKIKKVVIGANVTIINKNAFHGCKNLKTIKIKSKKLKKIGTGAFKKISKKATIYVPASKYKAYKKMLKKANIGKRNKIKKY